MAMHETTGTIHGYIGAYTVRNRHTEIRNQFIPYVLRIDRSVGCPAGMSYAVMSLRAMKSL